jgi:hypothetical protein
MHYLGNGSHGSGSDRWSPGTDDGRLLRRHDRESRQDEEEFFIAPVRHRVFGHRRHQGIPADVGRTPSMVKSAMSVSRRGPPEPHGRQPPPSPCWIDPPITQRRSTWHAPRRLTPPTAGPVGGDRVAHEGDRGPWLDG